jgi:hypothetical protein
MSTSRRAGFSRPPLLRLLTGLERNMKPFTALHMQLTNILDNGKKTHGQS